MTDKDKIRADHSVSKMCPRCDKEWSTSEDLEKEVMRYQQKVYDRDTTVRDIARHFANWQREQMMKEAVDATKIFSGIGSNSKTGECVPYTEYSICISDKLCDCRSKIKLIVIKED